MHAKCIAHPIQGLVCAHGYKDETLHILPIESVFVAIKALYTSVTFELFKDFLKEPIIHFKGQDVSPDWHSRLTSFVRIALEKVTISNNRSYLINIDQNFHFEMGIGSSAAVFAALTSSIVNAVGKDMDSRKISALARLGSYSAAAAVIGNVSVIRSGDSHEDNFAEVLCLADDFPYQLIVLPVAGRKLSTEIHADMPLSPYYNAWLSRAQNLSKNVVSMISQDTTDGIGTLIERYLYENLATISTGPRNLITWQPGTLQRLAVLRRIRC